MYPYVFQTEFYSLRWENVMIMVGIVAGLWLAMRRAAPKGRAYQDMLLDLAIYLVPAGLLGGRLWDVLFTWEAYAENPLQVLAIWNGGMSIQGCVLGGLVAALLFARARQVRVWELLDILAPGVLLGQAIGRIGCLTSGDAFGRPVAEVPWIPSWMGLVYHPDTPAALVYGQVPLVPAEAMEGLLDFVILAVLLRFVPKREVPGRVVLVYGILYSVVRFGLEFLRGDSLMWGGMKAAQLLSLGSILVCSVLLAGRYRSLHTNTTKAVG